MPALTGQARLSQVELAQLFHSLDAREPLVDPGLLNRLVGRLGSASWTDPYRTVCDLAESPRMAALLRIASPGSLPVYARTQGALQAVELHYASRFPLPEARKALRLALLLGGLGTALCVAETGSTLDRVTYERLVAGNVLAVRDPNVLDDAAATAVRLLVESDLLGPALQGRFSSARLGLLRAFWPGDLAPQRDDLILAAYLAAASARTEHRSYRDAATLEIVPCAAPGEETLSSLFTWGGAPGLRLPVHREIVRHVCPNLKVMADAVPLRDVSARIDAPPEAAPFHEVASADGTWLAELRLGSMPFEELRQVLNRFALERRFPVMGFVQGDGDVAHALTLIRAPRPDVQTPEVMSCNLAVEELADANGWRPVSEWSRRGLLVAMGLREGYEPGSPTHLAHNALARLLTYPGDLRTMPAHLLSAVVIGDELEENHEPALLIGTDRLGPVSRMAGDYRQEHVVVTDFDGRRTFTLENDSLR